MHLDVVRYDEFLSAAFGELCAEVPELVGALAQELAQAGLTELGVRQSGEAGEVSDEAAKSSHLLFDDLEGRVEQRAKPRSSPGYLR